MDNANTKDYLDKIRNQVVENLKRTAFAPSVQMTDVPRNPLVEGIDDEADDVLDDLDEDENKDKRFTQRRFDQYVEKAGELSDSEDEDENAANGVRRQPNALRRRNQANYRNIDDSGLDSGIATPQEGSSVGDGDMDTGLDTKMSDIPRTDPEASAAAGASNGQDTPADTDQAMDDDKGVSAAASQQPSPPAQDEDTTMEDAAPVHGPSEAALDEEIEKKLEPTDAEDNVRNAPLSPHEGQSPRNGSAAPVSEGAEASAEPAAAGESGSKTPAADATEETTKKEE